MTLAELEEMKKKMIKMEQLLKEKESTQPSAQLRNKSILVYLCALLTVINSGIKNRKDTNGRRLAHQPQCNSNGT